MAGQFPRLNRALVVVSVVVLGVGCRGKDEAAAPIRPIRAMQISDAPALGRRTFPGTAAAVDAVDLSFRVGGPLVAFPANRLGQQVKRGELLAEIDARDFEVRLRDAHAALAKARSELDAMRKARPEDIEKLKAEVSRAEAAAQYARAEYERNLSLRGTGAVSVSEIELSEAKAKLADAEVIQAKESLRIGEEGARPEEIAAKQSQIASLEAAVERASDELADTKLAAPFDGTISAAYVDNYQVVQAQQPIVRLVNTAELEIRVDVPENLIALAPQVTEAFVTFQAFPDVEIPARIAEIGAEAAPTTRTYPVKLRFTPPEGIAIRPGMTGTVRGRGDPGGPDDTTGHVVPASAVFPREGQPTVWVYDPADQAVHERSVTVVTTTPHGLKVTGVAVGDWVVTAGVHYLKDGQRVRLLAAPGEREAPETAADGEASGERSADEDDAS